LVVALALGGALLVVFCLCVWCCVTADGVFVVNLLVFGFMAFPCYEYVAVVHDFRDAWTADGCELLYSSLLQLVAFVLAGALMVKRENLTILVLCLIVTSFLVGVVGIIGTCKFEQSCSWPLSACGWYRGKALIKQHLLQNGNVDAELGTAIICGYAAGVTAAFAFVLAVCLLGKLMRNTDARMAADERTASLIEVAEQSNATPIAQVVSPQQPASTAPAILHDCNYGNHQPSLQQKMVRVSQALGVSQSLPLPEAVEQSQHAMKTSPVGSLAEQVDELYNALFDARPMPREDQAAHL